MITCDSYDADAHAHADAYADADADALVMLHTHTLHSIATLSSSVTSHPIQSLVQTPHQALHCEWQAHAAALTLQLHVCLITSNVKRL